MVSNQQRYLRDALIDRINSLDGEIRKARGVIRDLPAQVRAENIEDVLYLARTIGWRLAELRTLKRMEREVGT